MSIVDGNVTSTDPLMLYILVSKCVRYKLGLADLIGLLTTHLYADDTQVYGFCSSSKSGDLQSQLSTCVEDIAKWVGANRLQLNAAKTEILWCSSQRRVDQLPSLPFLMCGSSVGPSSVVRDLGVWTYALLWRHLTSQRKTAT